MKNKIAIFDLDGTLIDSLPAQAQFYRDFLNKIGKPRTIIERELGEISSPEEYKTYLKKLGLSQKEAQELEKEHKGDFRNYRCPIIPGATEMLSQLRKNGTQLILATYNTRTNLETHAREILPFFQETISRDEASPKLEAVRRIVSRQSGLYCLIGDTTWDYDISKKLSIPFIGVNWSAAWHDLSSLTGEIPLAKEMHEIPFFLNAFFNNS